jgi:hypothetical protein
VTPIEASADPSKEAAVVEAKLVYNERAVANFVAVEALPLKAPEKIGAFKVPVEV